MKVKLSTDGRQSNETWEVDKMDDVYGFREIIESVDGPRDYMNINTHLEISRGTDTAKIKFESKQELVRFHKRIGLCRATGSFLINGEQVEREVFITSF